MAARDRSSRSWESTSIVVKNPACPAVPAPVTHEEREDVPLVDHLRGGEVRGKEVELEVTDRHRVAGADALDGEPHLAEEGVPRARRVRREEHGDLAID